MGGDPCELWVDQIVWRRTADQPVQFGALAKDIRCQVAVIGAGITGLSAAFTLAEAGRDVVVLVVQDIARGGSGAAAAWSTRA